MKTIRQSSRRVAFLDRDGTLIWEPPETKQIDSLEKLRILPGVIDGLQILMNEGFSLVMVSNQNGIGTDKFPRDAFEIPQAALLQQLREQGIRFAELFICSHMPETNCACRKPKTGLVDAFLKENSIDFDQSFMIGDRDTDGEFAEAIGVRFVRMETNGRFPRFASQKRTTRETDIEAFVTGALSAPRG